MFAIATGLDEKFQRQPARCGMFLAMSFAAAVCGLHFFYPDQMGGICLPADWMLLNDDYWATRWVS